MRLLTTSVESGKLSLVEQIGKDIKPYAILSHTWGKDRDEVTFGDFENDSYTSKPGFQKLKFCQKQADNDGLEYFWIDTCCIDKASSAELTEAINSMYRWYQDAARCYVYLEDITLHGFSNLKTGSPFNWKDQFKSSRWFRRGWTLQELLAPKSVDFFDSKGKHLGNKESLLQVIYEATQIPSSALRGRDLGTYSIDVRLSWAKNRETKREEDSIYCLLGIFDIYMPLIYGEGRDRAFRRLMRELRQSSGGDPRSEFLPAAATGPRHTDWSRPPPPYDTTSTYDAMSMSKSTDLTKTIPDASASSVTPMWPGNIVRTRYSGEYLQRRDEISLAAKYGRWSEVFDCLDAAAGDFGENWSNVVRLKLPQDASEASCWTLLHQAAYVRAPMNVISALIERGSLRTIRTARADPEFSHHDLMAADIARERGFDHLADILAPVIHHTVPYQTVARLQSLFHEIIRADLGIQMAHLVLPDLVALTELRVPEMWFPIADQGSDRRAGYLYRLEERKLIVTKLGIEEQSPSVYTIK